MHYKTDRRTNQQTNEWKKWTEFKRLTFIDGCGGWMNEGRMIHRKIFLFLLLFLLFSFSLSLSSSFVDIEERGAEGAMQWRAPKTLQKHRHLIAHSIASLIHRLVSVRYENETQDKKETQLITIIIHVYLEEGRKDACSLCTAVYGVAGSWCAFYRRSESKVTQFMWDRWTSPAG